MGIAKTQPLSRIAFAKQKSRRSKVILDKIRVWPDLGYKIAYNKKKKRAEISRILKIG